jgi:hypothetical protein
MNHIFIIFLLCSRINFANKWMECKPLKFNVTVYNSTECVSGTELIEESRLRTIHWQSLDWHTLYCYTYRYLNIGCRCSDQGYESAIFTDENCQKKYSAKYYKWNNCSTVDHGGKYPVRINY